MSSNESDDDHMPVSKNYDVGYGRPPKAHRFQKGRSGNPAGRPKKKTTDKISFDAILEEARPVRINGEMREMQMRELFFRTQFEKACQGDLRAIKTMLDLMVERKLLDITASRPAIDLERVRQSLERKFRKIKNREP